MPDAIFADLLLGSVHGEAATQTTATLGRFRPAERTSIGAVEGGGRGREQRTMSNEQRAMSSEWCVRQNAPADAAADN